MQQQSLLLNSNMILYVHILINKFIYFINWITFKMSGFFSIDSGIMLSN